MLAQSLKNIRIYIFFLTLIQIYLDIAAILSDNKARLSVSCASDPGVQTILYSGLVVLYCKLNWCGVAASFRAPTSSLIINEYCKSIYKFGLSVCFFVCLSVCLFVSNKRQNG